MADKNLIKDREFISELCKAIEKLLGRKIASPRDFEYLSEQLTKEGSRISASTLKRIWGYNRDISPTYKPYAYTVLSLVNFLGYRDVEDYIENYDNEESQSAQYIGDTITIDTIMPGSIVDITWEPGRSCSLLCQEKGIFKVVHSERGRLCAGDIVRFQSLTQNAPLYFNEVERPATNERFIYVAGQKTGIRYFIHGIVHTDDDVIIS